MSNYSSIHDRLHRIAETQKKEKELKKFGRADIELTMDLYPDEVSLKPEIDTSNPPNDNDADDDWITIF